MKHLIGGFGVGFTLGLLLVNAGDHKPYSCLVLGVTVAMAMWGLLP